MPQSRVALIRIEVRPDGAISIAITGSATPAEALFGCEMAKKFIMDRQTVPMLNNLPRLNPREVP